MQVWARVADECDTNLQRYPTHLYLKLTRILTTWLQETLHSCTITCFCFVSIKGGEKQMLEKKSTRFISHFKNRTCSSVASFGRIVWVKQRPLPSRSDSFASGWPVVAPVAYGISFQPNHDVSKNPDIRIKENPQRYKSANTQIITDSVYSGLEERENEDVWLTKAGLGIGIDVLVFTPLHHTFQDGHQTFKALLSQSQLLNKDKFISIQTRWQTVKFPSRNSWSINHLLRCNAEFVSSTTLSYFWKVVDQTFKDVSSV